MLLPVPNFDRVNALPWQDLERPFVGHGIVATLGGLNALDPTSGVAKQEVVYRHAKRRFFSAGRAG
jgi:hypothetical protein